MLRRRLDVPHSAYDCHRKLTKCPCHRPPKPRTHKVDPRPTFKWAQNYKQRRAQQTTTTGS